MLFRSRFWVKFCEVINRQDLLTDERFKDNPSRTQNHDQLEALLNEITRTKKTAEWVALMEKNDIPCGPVNSIDQVVHDPHTVAREMIIPVEHSKAGSLKVVNSPMKLSRTPVKIEKASPELGEHTEEVLQNLLGYSREKIKDLRSLQAI